MEGGRNKFSTDEVDFLGTRRLESPFLNNPCLLAVGLNGLKDKAKVMVSDPSHKVPSYKLPQETDGEVTF